MIETIKESKGRLVELYAKNGNGTITGILDGYVNGFIHLKNVTIRNKGCVFTRPHCYIPEDELRCKIVFKDE